MAGASMNDIKSRIKSVNGTMQITKAMELVATSKLRHAKESAEGARPYMVALSEVMKRLASTSEAKTGPYGSSSPDGKPLYVIIAGDRGLAGGFNSNIFKLAKSLDKGEGVYLPIGKKAYEYFKRRQKSLLCDEMLTSAAINHADCEKLGEIIVEKFLKGEISEVTLIYTKFLSMLTQVPTSVKLLPLSAEENSGGDDPIYEGDPEEILGEVVPLFVSGQIFAAVRESVASECASRRSAMSSANKNAEEMIDTLMLKYNRARQAVITQEITEIVSGAEAL